MTSPFDGSSIAKATQQFTGTFVRPERTPFMQVVKAGVASVLAWLVCLIVFPDSVPIFGTIAALICVQDSISQSLNKSIERLAGVVVGVSVAVGASIVFGTPSWLFIAAIFVALALGWGLRMTGPATIQIAVSALLVIALGGQDLSYGVERIVETAIGGAIGVLINAFIVAPVRTSPASTAVAELVELTAESLERIALALAEPQTPEQMQQLLAEANRLRAKRMRVHKLLRTARESLKLNPRSNRHRAQLMGVDELFQRLQHIVTQVLGMSRALTDSYDPTITEDVTVQGLAEEFRRAAHDLRHLGYRYHDDQPKLIEPPALTSPYHIHVPNEEHWVLIGALMEDLRRTRIAILELQQEKPHVEGEL